MSTHYNLPQVKGQVISVDTVINGELYQDSCPELITSLKEQSIYSCCQGYNGTVQPEIYSM